MVLQRRKPYPVPLTLFLGFRLCHYTSEHFKQVVNLMRSMSKDSSKLAIIALRDEHGSETIQALPLLRNKDFV